jgi:transposase
MAWGEKAQKTAQGPGRRVYKLKTKKAVKEKLKEFYDLLTSLNPVSRLPKNTMRYREEWENSFLQVVHSRLTASAGRWLSSPKKRKRRKGRHIPKRPPYLLTVRFILSSGERRGHTDAPVAIDLRRRELRIPCVGITVPIPEQLARALEEENGLEPRPKFVTQLTSDGKLRIIAERAPEPRPLEVPIRIIAIDLNSRYGFVVAVFDFINEHCRLTYFKIFKPQNHGYREKVAAALKKHACKPAALEELRKLLPFTPSPKEAEELARRTLTKKRRLNNAFIEGLTARVRKLIREALQGGIAVAIVIDPIDEQSLRGTKLQGTLLRTRKRLENLAKYEGVHFAELRASGKLCPFCGTRGIENGHRTYKCPCCGAQWDRDRGATVNLVLQYLHKERWEECADPLPLRLESALRAWLRRHAKFLLRA